MDPGTHYKICPRCRQPQALAAAYCTSCGRQFRTTNPMPPVEERPIAPAAKTDPLAIAGLSCAIVGNWLFPLLFAPLAFVLCSVANHRISEAKGILKGRGAAVFGLILSLVEMGWLWYQFQQIG